MRRWLVAVLLLASSACSSKGQVATVNVSATTTTTAGSTTTIGTTTTAPPPTTTTKPRTFRNGRSTGLDCFTLDTIWGALFQYKAGPTAALEAEIKKRVEMFAFSQTTWDDADVKDLAEAFSLANVEAFLAQCPSSPLRPSSPSR